jgi:hypothetical protein
MKKHAVLILLAGILTVITAQDGWIKNYGDGYHDEWGMIIQGTTDGGYAVFGSIASGAGSSDMWLVKTDAQGDTQWTRVYGSEAPEYCHSGQQTSDGGYILAGSTESFGEGNTDIWLVKTDAVGDTLWTKTYGGTDYDDAESVYQTNDGGYIITGYRDGPDWGHPGYMWLLKTNPEGDTQWTKTWAAAQPDRNDFGIHVIQTSDGGYIIGGFVDFSGATYDAIAVMKTDALGDTVWTYRSASLMYCIYETSDETYVTVGQTLNSDLILVKVDKDGDVLWEKIYGDPSNNYLDNGRSVQGTSDGGYIVAGTYSMDISGSNSEGGDAWLLKFDPEGDTSWTRTYGSNPEQDGAFWVQPTSDGGYILTGSTETWSSGESDLFIMKTDSQGYVAVRDNPIADIEDRLEVLSPIGREIVLKYRDKPEGFHAQVFDAAGRKVADIDSPASSGTVAWGNGASPGVYFIRLNSGKTGKAYKVVIVE